VRVFLCLSSPLDAAKMTRFSSTINSIFFGRKMNLVGNQPKSKKFLKVLGKNKKLKLKIKTLIFTTGFRKKTY